MRLRRRGRRRPCAPGVERGILPQNCPLELLERRARVDAEAVDERAPRVLIHVERLGLAAGPIESEHEVGSQPFAERVPGDEAFELPDELGMTAEGEIGLDASFLCGQAKLLEPGDLSLCEGLVGEVRERGAAPEAERLVKQVGCPLGLVRRQRAAAFLDESLEPLEVELTRLELDGVPRRPGGDRSGPERLAKMRDVSLEDVGCRPRR